MEKQDLKVVSEWLKSIPAETQLKQALILGFLASRGATSEETCVRDGEMEAFCDWCDNFREQFNHAFLMISGSVTCEFSGEDHQVMEWRLTELGKKLAEKN